MSPGLAAPVLGTGVAGGGLAATGFPVLGFTILGLLVVLAGLILVRLAVLNHRQLVPAGAPRHSAGRSHVPQHRVRYPKASPRQAPRR